MPPAEEASEPADEQALLARRKAASAAAQPIVLAVAFMWMERLFVSQPAGQLVLSLTQDTSRTATIMSVIGSIQSILKLVIAPVVGSMSDKIGRRPFLMMSPRLLPQMR